MQKRYLNLQEYQSKKLMARYGVNIQRFEVASTVQEAVDSAHHLSKFCQFITSIYANLCIKFCTNFCSNL